MRVVDIIHLIREAGINVGGNYIFGLPHDTLESMNETLSFALENMTEMANFYCAMAYPGSPLHLRARQLKVSLPQTYTGYSQHSYDCLNMSNDNLTAAEILGFRDFAWQKYHTDPRYLDLLSTRFGSTTRKDVEKTATIKLKRKLLES